MQRWWLGSCGFSAAAWLLSVVTLTCAVARAQNAEAPPENVTASSPAETSAEAPGPAATTEPVTVAEPAASAPSEAESVSGLVNDFTNFLQFAIIGRFDYAEAHAKNLLSRPDVNPLSKEAASTLVKLCEARPTAIDTLVILVTNSTIGEDAGKIMALIREAYRQTRMQPEQIDKHIKMLAGTPTEQATGLERLIDSGEYAVPRMLAFLGDSTSKALHPYIVRALPRLGKPAVNPLVIGLSIKNDVVQAYVADALGRLGYPQAMPYLKRLAEAPDTNPVVRQTAVEAIGQIVVSDPRVKDAPATQLFRELAEGYYAEEDSLAPDRKEPRANVWVVDGMGIKAIDVPRQIFCMVMCMKSCKDSLALDKDQMNVLALWIAADFRRESRLGLDVESTAVATVDDGTEPANTPRSLYYASGAGPDCCGMVLNRGLKDRDRPVILGAIAGMSASAGPAAVAGPEGRGGGLAEAIRFPDQLVRIRAALVLGRILPKQMFPGADEVVPVLASAFAITGQKHYLVVDPDEKMAGKIVDDLTKSGAKAMMAAQLELGLAHAAEQFAQLDGVFLASDVVNPGAVDAVRVLSRDQRFGLAPVVMYVKEGGMVTSDQVVQADWRVGRVLVVDDQSPAALLVAKLPQVEANFGYRPLTAENGVALSLEAALALERIAAYHADVFDDARTAEGALIKALDTHASEKVRIATTRVLAQLNTTTAQSAIAAVALSKKQTPTLRIAAFASLADSAHAFGDRLDGPMKETLIAQAKDEPDLQLRTAASQALGAVINKPAELAVEAILKQMQGE